MVLAWWEERGSAVARLARRRAEEKRLEVLMMAGWRIWGCKCGVETRVCGLNGNQRTCDSREVTIK